MLFVLLFIGSVVAAFLLGKWAADQLSTPHYKLLRAFGNTTAASTQSCRARDDCKESANVWRPVFVSASVDVCLSRFLERTIDVCLCDWRKKMDSTDACGDICEAQVRQYLRPLLRDSCVLLLRRFRRIDLASFIIRRLVSSAVRHLDCCLLARRLWRTSSASVDISDVDFDAAVMKLYGADTHVALSGGEARYLCSLVDRMMSVLLVGSADGRHLLQSDTARCFVREVLSRRVLLPLVDLLAHADTINRLLILLLQLFQSPNYQPQPSSAPSGENVELLRQWTRPSNGENITEVWTSPLHVRLTTVLQNRDLLYAFSQNLRERRAIHLLNFCLAVDEFNGRALNPQACGSDSQWRWRILTEARQIYNNFLSEKSADFVCVDSRLIADLAAQLDISSSAADKLSGSSCSQDQTSTVALRELNSLYEAYEQIYSRLEYDHTPPFLRSQHCIDHWCRRMDGDGGGAAGVGSRWSHSHGRVTAVTRWSRRLRDVIRTPTVDGRPDLVDELGEELFADTKLLPYHDDNDYQDDDVEDLDDCMECGTSAPADIDGDLSHWLIDIPLVSMAVDPCGKQVILFILDVQCPSSFPATAHGRPPTSGEEGSPLEQNSTETAEDGGGWHWRTARQLGEFYILEKRLLEFHGDLADVRLPPRQSLLSASFYTQDFLDDRKPVFLSFLRCLVRLPGLQFSQLVRSFLTASDQMFTSDSLTASSSFSALSADLGITKIIRTVPRKFRKERGQCLVPFLSSLLLSTEIAPQSATTTSGGGSGKHSRSASSSSIRLRHSRSSSGVDQNLMNVLMGCADALPQPQNTAANSASYNSLSSQQPTWLAARPRGSLSCEAGVYDQLVQLLMRCMEEESSFFTCSRRWFWRCLSAVLFGARRLVKLVALDNWLCARLNQLLSDTLNSEQCCHLLHLAEHALYGPEPEKSGAVAAQGLSASGGESRSDSGGDTDLLATTVAAALAAVRQFVPMISAQLLTVGGWCRVSQQLLQCIRLPSANRQLVYRLLDELVEELFPELLDCDPLLKQQVKGH